MIDPKIKHLEEEEDIQADEFPEPPGWEGDEEDGEFEE